MPTRYEEQAAALASTIGELERSIELIAGVREAHVHVVAPAPSLAGEERPVARRASVLVTVPRRQSLNTDAIQALVAGAIVGLTADQVTVVVSEVAKPDVPRDVVRSALAQHEVATMALSALAALSLIAMVTWSWLRSRRPHAA